MPIIAQTISPPTAPSLLLGSSSLTATTAHKMPANTLLMRYNPAPIITGIKTIQSIIVPSVYIQTLYGIMVE